MRVVWTRNFRYVLVFLAGLLLCLIPAAIQGQTSSPAVTGDYSGPLGPLQIVIHIQRDAAGKLSGTLDSPNQGVRDIPADNFVLSGQQFSFSVPSISANYRGSVSIDGKTITGTWDQGQPTTLVLTQTAAAPAFVPSEKPSAVDGDWRGAIDSSIGHLPAVIHVKSDRNGKEYVTFDSPSQHAFGLEGEKAVLQGNAFSFQLPGVGNYQGQLNADGGKILGTWHQGVDYPLNLTRVVPFIPSEKPSAVDGEWNGMMQTKDGPLHAVIRVKSDRAGREYVDLDSPDQDARNIETSDAVLSGKSFSFEVPDLKAIYKGVLNADGSAIEGTWTQGAEFPLRFSKAGPSLSQPPPEMLAPTVAVSLPELKGKLDAELKPRIENPLLAGSQGIGVAIGVYEHGERKIFTYGIAKEDSLFEIGSITKTFTGLILSEMVLEKQVSLETPLRELLPAGTVKKPDAPEITLLSLATHHSALARMPNNFHPKDPANPYADYTEKDLYAYINNVGVATNPSARFAYSNVGVALLGTALANRAGKSYSDLLKQDVLSPLHMDHSYIVLSPSEQNKFLQGHSEKDVPAHAWDLDAMAPAGGIRSDIRDMLKYVEAQLHPPAGKLTDAITFQHELRADMDNNGKIAINWMFDPRGGNYNHGGGTGGFTSFAFFNTKKDIAGVVLVNRASGLAESLGMQISEMLEGMPIHPIRK